MFKQVIITKYLGPTDRKGSRVSARTTNGMRVIIEWDDALNSEKNHYEAMKRLACNLNWLTYPKAIGGTLPGGSIVWVFP